MCYSCTGVISRQCHDMCYDGISIRLRNPFIPMGWITSYSTWKWFQLQLAFATRILITLFGDYDHPKKQFNFILCTRTHPQYKEKCQNEVKLTVALKHTRESRRVRGSKSGSFMERNFKIILLAPSSQGTGGQLWQDYFKNGKA